MRLIAAALLLFAAAPALAEAPRWDVDASKSRVGFVALQSGAEAEGNFTAYEADIRFDPEDPSASRVEVTIETASVESGSRDRDDAVRGPGLLDASQFPSARFLAEGFAHLGGESYEARGSLTMRDVTRDVVLPFTLSLDDSGGARAVGELVIDRLDYGVGQGTWADTSIIAAEVRIVIDIAATRAAP